MNKVKKFILDVKAEMVKVSWPNKNELLNSTSVILISTGVLAFFIWIMDIVYTFIVRLILG